MRVPGVQTPVALQVGAGVSIVPVQLGMPQLEPTTAGDQPLMLRVESQIWQWFDGFTMPSGKHDPKIAQMPVAAVCTQACVASSQLSVVQVDESSHALPPPDVQWSAPSQ